ncbi:hypothetical protein BDP27DRAFT_1497696 [Rhodocollybia butyracea]|uniref:Protein kinase domain-containing protein n=1 Tax=Rhodocollybia butyracea TaxID=206335 RepID=A0A9P5UAB4_9AGAR|nr:hypothetical protein BDP27DRAFT_1497696 [Rhodocollybia butyracea]
MNMLATRGLRLTEAREEAISVSDVESRRFLNKALVEYKAFRQLQTSKKNCLHWLNIEMAEHMMDYIQLLLDLRNEVVASPTQKYEDLHGLLRYLSSKFQLLPPSLIIHDVEKEGTNAVAGGGFADIWRGKVKGRSVCLKVLRLFLEQDERARMNIRDQFCREALVWRQLRHPNILPLLGSTPICSLLPFA